VRGLHAFRKAAIPVLEVRMNGNYQNLVIANEGRCELATRALTSYIWRKDVAEILPYQIIRIWDESSNQPGCLIRVKGRRCPPVVKPTAGYLILSGQCHVVEFVSSDEAAIRVGGAYTFVFREAPPVAPPELNEDVFLLPLLHSGKHADQFWTLVVKKVGIASCLCVDFKDDKASCEGWQLQSYPIQGLYRRYG